jgi:shikimate dehydrogenase
LGAGGAARAIINALGRAGIDDIRLVNRTRDKAEALSGLAPHITIGDWQDRAALADGCGLLVNTTSLGMTGQPPLEMPLDGLKSGALVSDIVYTPLHTPLLRAAQASGYIAVDGLGMLLHQAALSFEIWTGMRPHIDDKLRALLATDLAEKD